MIEWKMYLVISLNYQELSVSELLKTFSFLQLYSISLHGWTIHNSLSQSPILECVNHHLQLLTILQVICYTYVILHAHHYICWISSPKMELLVQEINAFVILLLSNYPPKKCTNLHLNQLSMRLSIFLHNVFVINHFP